MVLDIHYSHIHKKIKRTKSLFRHFGLSSTFIPFPNSNSSPEIIVSGFEWEPHCLTLSPPSFTNHLTLFSQNGFSPSMAPNRKTTTSLPFLIGDRFWCLVFLCFLLRLWGCRGSVWLRLSKAFLLGGFLGCLNPMNRVGFFLYSITLMSNYLYSHFHF